MLQLWQTMQDWTSIRTGIRTLAGRRQVDLARSAVTHTYSSEVAAMTACRSPIPARNFSGFQDPSHGASVTVRAVGGSDGEFAVLRPHRRLPQHSPAVPTQCQEQIRQMVGPIPDTPNDLPSNAMTRRPSIVLVRGHVHAPAG